MNYYEEYLRWTNSPSVKSHERAVLESISGDNETIKDLFGTNLSFGTAGLRGIRGLGTNRMNAYVVRRATQGLSNYLKNSFFNPSVVISYDSRLDSREFAMETACVLTANGINTYLFNEMMPVPVLSYAINKLECFAGVMITASHNPKEYNGYKVYNSTGGQILDEEAAKILKEIDKIDIFDDINTMCFEDALKAECQYVDESVYESYLKEMDKATSFTQNRDIGIIYTPLNGSGRRPVQDILAEKGFSFFTVSEQEMEDGNFTTCPSPNPERLEVYDIAKKYGEKQNADILLATDPDCDRVGVMVKHNEDYVLLSGNEIGILLLNYICQVTPNISYKYLYTSMVSTPLVDNIAKSYGVKVRRTPVGFKYIGNLIAQNPNGFLFGFEESNGYLMGSYARDKDGVAGAYAICQMAAYYKSAGKSLIDVLEEIYLKYGFVVDKTISVETKNTEEMQLIMGKLRDKKSVESTFSGLKSYIDYNEAIPNSNLPKMNLIQMEFEDYSRLIVRPSGTEPKIKYYVSSMANEKSIAVDRVEAIVKTLSDYLNGDK